MTDNNGLPEECRCVVDLNLIPKPKEKGTCQLRRFPDKPDITL